MRFQAWSGLILTALGLLLLAPFGCVVVENFFPLWIWRAEVRGRVTDELGQPVSGARVVAEYFGDRSKDVIPGSRSPAITDVHGEFELSSVPGAVTLFARKDGVGIGQPLDLELEDGQEVDNVEISLDPGGRITGECLGADGMPLSRRWRRWISVEQADYRHWGDEDRIANIRSRDDGEFVIDGVPTGEVRVMLGPSFPFTQERIVTVKRGETTHVRFETPLEPGKR